LKKALDPSKGIAPHVDLTLIPWGNSYYTGLEECGGARGDAPYDLDLCHCWGKKCGKGSTPEDRCFEGSKKFQHGTFEGATNTLFSYLIDKDGLAKHFDAIACIEADYKQLNNPPFTCGSPPKKGCIEGTLSLEELAINCGVSKEDYDTSQTDAGTQTQLKAAKATPAHPDVPYVLLDGVQVVDPVGTVSIEDVLCAALKKKGVTPPGCTSAFSRFMSNLYEQFMV